MDKHIWTLGGASGASRAELLALLLQELPETVDAALPTALEAVVTIQDPEQYSGALVGHDGSRQPVTAALEVSTAERCPPLDAFHERLQATWAAVQGWRVRPTLVYDSTRPRGLGEPSRSPAVLVFVERLDGTTPEHFDHHWYVHAGHADGQEAESEGSRAERRREEAAGPDRLYRQNRVVEPITPTSWVLHGYSQLQLGLFVPEVGPDPYPRVRGEEAFDRWPPRILQGSEYRIR